MVAPSANFFSTRFGGQLFALREEVRRMNRLVEQLLCVARLDSVVLDVSSSTDLHQIAEEVVGSMARLALATAARSR